MEHIFYRKNKSNTNKFLSSFINDKSNEIVKNILNITQEIEHLSRNILKKIDQCIVQSDCDRSLLLKSKRKIKKGKILENITVSHLKSSFIFYNEKIELRNELMQQLGYHLEQNFKADIKKLGTFFSTEDLLLFRNKFLKNKLESSNMNLKKKDRISLYKYAAQLCLKTGGVGTTNEVGCIGLSKTDKLEYLVPKSEYSVNIHSYIENRILLSLITSNLEAYKHSYGINSNYIINGNKIIFKVLIDDKKSNIFSGQEREVQLVVSKNIEWLIKQDKITYRQLKSHFNNDEISKLLHFGILLFKQIDPGVIYNWSEVFEELDKNIINSLIEMNHQIENLNVNFSCNGVNELSDNIKKICDFLKIDTLDFPVVTIDSYCNIKKLSSSTLNHLRAFSNISEELSKFFSIFDASKKVEKLSFEFMKKHYPLGISFKDFNELDIFLSEMAENVFSKINLGALRSGFFDSEYPMIQIIINFLINQNDSQVILSSSYIQEFLKTAEQEKYNFEHSYAFFLQEGEKQLYVNHVYKGYGIFNNRYRHNFNTKNFEQNYGFTNLVDIPYNFGFNANSRPKRRYFDALNLSYFRDDIDVSYKDISIVADNQHQNLKFLTASKEQLNLTFLGSMTPIVLPKTIAMFNSISLTGGLYFDLSDLVLRKKFELDSDSHMYHSPQICFKTNSLVLAREKYLVRTSYIKNMIRDSSQVENNMLNLNRLFGKSKIYIKEFSVDSNFKNKFMKPLFIELNSLLGLENFLHYIEHIEWITVEDIQPELSDNCLIEYIFESKNTIHDR